MSMLPMPNDPRQSMDVFSNVAVDGADLTNAQASHRPAKRRNGW